MSETKKIFLSHSSQDKDLIKLFIRFMQLGLDIAQKDIFCTSINGALVCGEPFSEEIKTNICNCENVVLFITENYFLSPFCMAELGAAWSLSKKVTPIIIPPMGADQFNKTPLRNLQFISLCKKESLYTLSDHFTNVGIASASTLQKNEAISELWPDIEKYINRRKQEILVKDESGYYTTIIKRVREREDKNNLNWIIAEITGLLYTGDDYASGETHWLMYLEKEFEPLTTGERVKFKVQTIKPLYPQENTRNVYVEDIKLI